MGGQNICPAFEAFRIGARVYRDKTTLLVPNDQGFREWIASAYLVWTKGRPEFLSEFDYVHHRNIFTTQITNSDACTSSLVTSSPGSNGP